MPVCRPDPQVARTRDRPIAGRVGPREALYLFIALVTLAYLLVLTMNVETIVAFGGALLAATYPKLLISPQKKGSRSISD